MAICGLMPLPTATLPIGFPHRISRLVVGYYLEEHEPNLLLKRYLLCSLMGALSENQLTFTSGIGSHDNPVALAEQTGNYLNLFHYSGIGLIALVGLDLSRNEGEHLRDDGQVLRVEASDTISFGQGRLYQMPECPSDVVAVTGEVTFLSFRCPYDAGYLSCHGWLFCCLLYTSPSPRDA